MRISASSLVTSFIVSRASSFACNINPIHSFCNPSALALLSRQTCCPFLGEGFSSVLSRFPQQRPFSLTTAPVGIEKDVDALPPLTSIVGIHQQLCAPLLDGNLRPTDLVAGAQAFAFLLLQSWISQTLSSGP